MIEIFALSYNGQPASADVRGVFGPDGGTLGRGADNQLPLPDPARHVSRVQGRVRWDGARFWIANVAEANPMFLNDEEIESKKERPLASGDELRVGLYVLRVREATGVAVDYRPAPATAPRPAPSPATPPAAPVNVARGSGSIDSLLGGAPLADNPFADILGGSGGASLPGLAPSPPPLPPMSAPMSPMAGAGIDLRPQPPLAPSVSNAGSGANPFADLLGPGADAGFAPSAPANARAAPFPDGVIPPDFDPFAAPQRPSQRNSDDPLRDLAKSGIDLKALGNEAPPPSLVDFDPSTKADRYDALRGGTPSLVDPMQAVDPMQLFGGSDDPMRAAGDDPLPPDAMPMADGVPLIDAYFAPARSLPDPNLPAPPEAPSPPAPIAQSPQSAPGPGDGALEPVAKPGAGATAPSGNAATPIAEPAPAPEVYAPRPPPARMPPPSVARPPASPGARAVPAESRPSRTDAAALETLVAAFLEGARVPNVNIAGGLTPALMQEMGAMVYQAIAGAMALIAARQITKREIGAELTMIVATRNNPLKFLPTPEAALMQILGPKMPGFMGPTDAMGNAFEDLRAHEVGVIAGTRAAFAEVLRRFDPKLLDERLGKGGALQSLFPSLRHAKLWELFEQRYGELYRDAQDDFDSLYGLAFTKAYEEEVARNRQTNKKD